MIQEHWLYTLVIALHFIADWFQPRVIQNNKHNNFKLLCIHVYIATLPCLIIGCIFVNTNINFITYYFFNVLTHFLIDLRTSNLAFQAKLDKKEYKLITITAVDCFLHIALLIYSTHEYIYNA